MSISHLLIKEVGTGYIYIYIYMTTNKTTVDNSAQFLSFVLPLIDLDMSGPFDSLVVTTTYVYCSFISRRTQLSESFSLGPSSFDTLTTNNSKEHSFSQAQPLLPVQLVKQQLMLHI
jgi:hypothetical protein